MVGPGVGGLLIAAAGVEAAYLVDAVSCLAMAVAALRMGPQPPHAAAGADRIGIGRSIAEGLRFVRGNAALKGSFAIDLFAMTFGMPRALFPVLALTVYGAGAAGTGALFAAVSAGATVAALTTGWLGHARRLGRIVICAVVVWGLAIAAAGLVLEPVAGDAAARRSPARRTRSAPSAARTINQTVTPDALRGRMSSVFMIVVTSGPRLGDLESGVVASLTSARFSVLSGGLACLAGVALVLIAFPALLAYDAEQRGTPMAHLRRSSHRAGRRRRRSSSASRVVARAPCGRASTG